MLVLAVRYGDAWPAAGAAVLLSLAAVLRPVAVEATENSLILALFCTLAVSAGLIGALVARLAAVDRRRHAEQVRLEQRLTFARDLHDFVAHHVTGIVVQAQGSRWSRRPGRRWSRRRWGRSKGRLRRPSGLCDTW
ncbi:histidine kinase [Streptomyces sp. M10(2022)]